MERSSSRKTILIIIGIIIAILLAIFFAQKIDGWMDNSSYEASLNTNVTIGKHKYRAKNLSTYVIIGIDNEKKIDDPIKSGESDQCDFIGYVFVDHTKQQYNVLHINRDTITTVRKISSIDPFAVTNEIQAQIALSHVYGGDASAKNKNVVKSLSLLFRSLLPVNEYLGFTMKAIPSFNDFVGGVDIKITSELADAGLGLVEGTTVSLHGDDALSFIRARGEASDKSNIARMRRQKAYMEEYVKKAKTKELTYKGLTENAVDYIESNVVVDDLNSLFTTVKSYSFGSVLSLEGTSGVDSNGFVTFNVSEETINNFLTTYIYDLAE